MLALAIQVLAVVSLMNFIDVVENDEELYGLFELVVFLQASRQIDPTVA